MVTSAANCCFFQYHLHLGASVFLRIAAYCLLIVLMSSVASNVSAHNVVSGVYADGMLIDGEIGFSNGDMAEAGSSVKVFNADDGLITELVLDENGAFSYQAKTVSKHVFKANLSSGHVAEMVVEANELTAPMGGIVNSLTKAPTEVIDKISQPLGTQGALLKTEPPNTELLKSRSVSAPSLANTVPDNSTLNSEITVDQLQSIVRSAVAQQVRPLQKDLQAYKEKVMFRDITGGLGFIFGLFGVAAWMASRRKDPLKDQPTKGEKNATVS